MTNIPTSALLKIGSVLVGLTTTAAAVGGWWAMNVLGASLTLTPDIAAAADPSRDVLAAIDEAMSEVRSTLDLVGSVTDRVSESAEKVAEVTSGVADVATGGIPDALAALEESLPALIDTASVLDDALSTLGAFGVPYAPEVPFDEALRSVQENLDGLPETITRQGTRLEALVPDIRTAGEDTAELSGRIEAIDDQLVEAQSTIDDYRSTLDDLSRFTAVSSRISSSVPLIRAALVLLATTGLALAVVGWSLSNRLPDTSAGV